MPARNPTHPNQGTIPTSSQTSAWPEVSSPRHPRGACRAGSDAGRDDGGPLADYSPPVPPEHTSGADPGRVPHSGGLRSAYGLGRWAGVRSRYRVDEREGDMRSMRRLAIAGAAVAVLTAACGGGGNGINTTTSGLPI